MHKLTLVIPESFELHGITYRVIQDDSLVAKNDNLGEASYRTNQVILQSLIVGVPLSSDRQGQVYLHELTHHILREMGSKLRSDETFIDLFSSLLHQALVTSVYQSEVEDEID